MNFPKISLVATILAAAILLPQLSQTALSGELDGKTFCREVRRDGSFGQPAGITTLCVSFRRDVMTDESDTLGGRPPEKIPYVLVANKILIVKNGSLYSDYVVDEQQKVIKSKQDAVFELKEISSL